MPTSPVAMDRLTSHAPGCYRENTIPERTPAHRLARTPYVVPSRSLFLRHPRPAIVLGQESAGAAGAHRAQRCLRPRPSPPPTARHPRGCAGRSGGIDPVLHGGDHRLGRGHRVCGGTLCPPGPQHRRLALDLRRLAHPLCERRLLVPPGDLATTARIGPSRRRCPGCS